MELYKVVIVVGFIIGLFASCVSLYDFLSKRQVWVYSVSLEIVFYRYIISHIVSVIFYYSMGYESDSHGGDNPFASLTYSLIWVVIITALTIPIFIKKNSNDWISKFVAGIFFASCLSFGVLIFTIIVMKILLGLLSLTDNTFITIGFFISTFSTYYYLICKDPMGFFTDI